MNGTQQAPQQVQLPPTTQLTVHLELQQWNGVLAALGDAPYRIAAPLIQSMSEQLQQEAQAAANQLEGPQMANGLDRVPPGNMS